MGGGDPLAVRSIGSDAGVQVSAWFSTVPFAPIAPSALRISPLAARREGDVTTGSSLSRTAPSWRDRSPSSSDFCRDRGTASTTASAMAVICNVDARSSAGPPSTTTIWALRLAASNTEATVSRRSDAAPRFDPRPSTLTSGSIVRVNTDRPRWSISAPSFSTTAGTPPSWEALNNAVIRGSRTSASTRTTDEPPLANRSDMAKARVVVPAHAAFRRPPR